MKCDELQYERLGDANKTYPASTLVIRKQFVDEAIEEMNVEVERLDDLAHAHNLECLQKENKIEGLKRALWLARAERAKSAAMFWNVVWTNEPNGSNDVYDIDFNVLTDKLKRRCFNWCKIFEEVERKCRYKAEEYK